MKEKCLRSIELFCCCFSVWSTHSQPTSFRIENRYEPFWPLKYSLWKKTTVSCLANATISFSWQQPINLTISRYFYYLLFLLLLAFILFLVLFAITLLADLWWRLFLFELKTLSSCQNLLFPNLGLKFYSGFSLYLFSIITKHLAFAAVRQLFRSAVDSQSRKKVISSFQLSSS